MKNECSELLASRFHKRPCRIRVFALVAALIFFAVSNLPAQAPSTTAPALGAQFPGLKLVYGKGKSLNVRPDRYPDREDFEPIAIYPDQQLQLNLQFALSAAGQTIFVGVVDGSGTITTATNSGAVIVGSDGTVSIGYQAPHDSGHYRVAFRFGNQDSSLPLTVLDSSQATKPGNCPRAN